MWKPRIFPLLVKVGRFAIWNMMSRSMRKREGREVKGRWKSEPRLWRRSTARLTNFDSRLARTEAFHVFHYNAKRLSPRRVYRTNRRGSGAARCVEETPGVCKENDASPCTRADFFGVVPRVRSNRRQPHMTMRFPRREQFPDGSEREPTV